MAGDHDDDHLAHLLDHAAVTAVPSEDGWNAIVKSSERYAGQRRRARLSVLAAVAAAVVLLTFAVVSRKPSDRTVVIGTPPATTRPAPPARAPGTTEPASKSDTNPEGVGRLFGTKTGLTFVVFDGVSGFDAIDLDTGAARRLPITYANGQTNPDNSFAITAGGRIAASVSSEGRGTWSLFPLDLAGPADYNDPLSYDAQSPTELAIGGYGSALQFEIAKGPCPSFGSRAPARRVDVTISADATGACNRLQTLPDNYNPTGSAIRKLFPIRDVAGLSPLIMVAPRGHKAVIADSQFHTQLVDLDTGTVTDTGTEPLGRPGIGNEAQRFWSTDSRFFFEYRRSNSSGVGAPAGERHAELIMLDTRTGTWASTSLNLGNTSLFAAAIESATGPDLSDPTAKACPTDDPTAPGAVALSDVVCQILGP